MEKGTRIETACFVVIAMRTNIVQTIVSKLIGIIERLKEYFIVKIINDKTSLKVSVQYDRIHSLKGKQKCVWANNTSFESVL